MDTPEDYKKVLALEAGLHQRLSLPPGNVSSDKRPGDNKSRIYNYF